MATVSPMPAKADPAWIRAPNALGPMVGANCRGFVNRFAIEVGAWRFVEGGETAERSGMVVARVYPASDPAAVARPYVMRILARQDDLRYVIIKSKAVSLICIYVHVIPCARSCYGPLRFYFMFWVWACPSPIVFVAVYIRRLDG
jgi:hypothetical protein